VTRKEILAIPAGREMRDLIATDVMKWEWDDGGRGFRSGWDKPDGSWVDFDDWRPDEDISATWEVEEKIFDDGFAVFYIKELRWIVSQENNLHTSKDWLEFYYLAHATPHERSRAALLAVKEAFKK